MNAARSNLLASTSQPPTAKFDLLLAAWPMVSFRDFWNPLWMAETNGGFWNQE